jgi:hypothetical protein
MGTRSWFFLFYTNVDANRYKVKQHYPFLLTVNTMGNPGFLKIVLPQSVGSYRRFLHWRPTIADLTKNHLRGGINGVVTFLPATDGFPSGLHPFQAWCAEGGTLTSGEIQPRLGCENRQETCSFTMFYLSTTWICLRTPKKIKSIP